MGKIKFYICDKHITDISKKQPLSPGGGYQAQHLSRRNPSAIPCSNCGKFIKWVRGSQLQAIANQQLNQEVQ